MKSICQNKSALRLVVTLSILVAAAHRLPAPISEIQENVTPAPSVAPEQTSKPKKSRAKAAAAESESTIKSKSRAATPAPPALLGPAKFAGAWSGKISQGLLGHNVSTLTIASDATSVELSHNLGGGTSRATINGGTISWNSGVVGEIKWTLAPNSDGQTAKVTMKGLLVNDTQTFRRGAAAAAEPAPPKSRR